MNELIAGMTLGLLMASVFICAAMLMLFSMVKNATARGAESPLGERTPMTVALGVVATAYPGWAVVGGMCGVLYRISVEQAPGGGLGSPNVLYTLGVLVAVLMLAAPFAVLLRRMLAFVVTLTLCAVAIFGWFLPYYAA